MTTQTADELFEARRRIREARPDVEVLTASLFISPNLQSKVDVHGGLFYGNSGFEWGLYHGRRTPLCVDFDGVLYEEGHRGPVIPNFPIQAVISSRPIAETDFVRTWCSENGVKCDAFLLKPSPQLTAVQHKAYWIRRLHPKWYWESSMPDAALIASESLVLVLCIENMKLYNP
jgi:hypothetical protein